MLMRCDVKRPRKKYRATSSQLRGGVLRAELSIVASRECAPASDARADVTRDLRPPCPCPCTRAIYSHLLAITDSEK
ncbi:unnamed protein product [Colias eurytheme]|nr:unnamed protein product [Colias eurytheme]